MTFKGIFVIYELMEVVNDKKRRAPDNRLTNLGNLDPGDRAETVLFEDGVYYHSMRTGKVVEKIEDPPLVTVEFPERRGVERLKESYPHTTMVINWGPETRVPRPEQPLPGLSYGLPRIGGHRLVP